MFQRLSCAFMHPDGLSMFRGASEATGSSLRRWDAHSPIFQLTKLRHATPQRLGDDSKQPGKENVCPNGCFREAENVPSVGILEKQLLRHTFSFSRRLGSSLGRWGVACQSFVS